MIDMRAVAAAALAVALMAGPAAAEPPSPAVGPAAKPEQSDDASRARQLLEEASRLYTDGEFRAALDTFHRSYDIDPSWRALNGIALCQRALGQEVAAYRTYEELLLEFGSILSVPQRTVAEKRKRELAARLSWLEISTKQAGVRITVDGREIGRGPLRVKELVLPGAHQLLATRPGHRAFAQQISVRPGASRVIAIALEPDRARVVVKFTDPPPTRPIRVWIPWVTIAGGAIMVGAGGLLALEASSDIDAFDAQVAEMAGDPPRQLPIDDSVLDSAGTQQTVGAAMLITGGAAVVTGVALAIFNRKRGGKRTDAAALRPLASGAVLAFTF